MFFCAVGGRVRIFVSPSDLDQPLLITEGLLFAQSDANLFSSYMRLFGILKFLTFVGQFFVVLFLRFSVVEIFIEIFILAESVLIIQNQEIFASDT